MTQIPTPGRIVLYTISEGDAEAQNKRRADAAASLTAHRETADGSQIHAGNTLRVGDVYPMIIVRAWGTTPTSLVNGQVLLDGNDTLWVTSVGVGEGPRTFAWPPRF
jgi:hypothetical protein